MWSWESGCFGVRVDRESIRSVNRHSVTPFAKAGASNVACNSVRNVSKHARINDANYANQREVGVELFTVREARLP